MYQKILAEYEEAQRYMKDEEGIGGASVALRVEIYPGFSLVELITGLLSVHRSHCHLSLCYKEQANGKK